MLTKTTWALSHDITRYEAFVARILHRTNKISYQFVCFVGQRSCGWASRCLSPPTHSSSSINNPSPPSSLFSPIFSSSLLSQATHIDLRHSPQHQSQQPTTSIAIANMSTSTQHAPPAPLPTLEGETPMEDAVVAVVVVVVVAAVVEEKCINVFCATTASGGTRLGLALSHGILHALQTILMPGVLKDVRRRETSDNRSNNSRNRYHSSSSSSNRRSSNSDNSSCNNNVNTLPL